MDSINLNKENGLKLWATDWNKLISTINLIIDKINTQEGSTSITKLSQLINDSGFITEEDVSGKANKSELARVATSGSYNDLIDKPSQEASAQGPEGKSAYQVAVDNGFVGTEQEWLASLKGEAGQNGLNGQDGASGLDGAPGQDGLDGSDGKSAYEIAVELGYEGTLELWLESLHGQDGLNGQNGSPGQNGLNGITPHIDSSTKHWFIGETDTNIVAEGLDGQNGVNGTNGKSAYQSYLDTTTDNPPLTELQWANNDYNNLKNKPSLATVATSGSYNDLNDKPIMPELIQSNWNLTDNTLVDYIKNKPTITNGTDGVTPHIDSTSKHWMIGSSDTGIVAEGLNGTNGTNGLNGITPHIDSTTGNWFIGNTDTGVHALGPAGQGGSGSGVLSDWNETDNTSLAYIANKPTIPTVPANETATSGGNTLSVVTTGDKYNWNNKANIWQGTQAQYDTLSPNYDSNTIYIITAS